jgi:uncharacterized phage protein (TIGR01671 family)
MRDIKFRAWIADAGMMTAVTAFEANSQGPKWLMTLDSVERPYEFKRYGQSSRRIAAHRAILMQYTGFKSTDGVDIYEGDIVQIGTEYNNLSQKNGRPVYEAVRMIHGRWEPLCFFKDGLFTVHGNSFENPELLEAKS